MPKNGTRRIPFSVHVVKNSISELSVKKDIHAGCQAKI